MRQGSFDHSQSASSRRGEVGSLRVPFGLREGRMWNPKQVAPGLQCGCICPACQAPLVAKAADSEHRRPHFAHLAESNCRAGYETALHKKAKQLLADQMAVVLPAWDGEESMPNPPELADEAGMWWTGTPVDYPARRVQLQDVRLELAQGDYTPDVLAQDDQGDLLIEIRVSHAVDALKRRRIQAEGKRLVEIDLSSLSPDVLQDEGLLVQAVLYDPANRHWLSCPEATEAWRAAYRQLKSQVAQRNQEIALERQRLEDARHVQLKAAEDAQAHRMAQQENRARFQEQQRAPYVELLEGLPDLVSVSRIETLLAEYRARDGEEAEGLISQLPSSAVQKAVRYCGPNAWIYRVHPALWQAASYHRFVLGRPAGAQFNQRELAQWVMQNFGREEGLYALFRAQYQFRSKVRSAGIRKNRISFWAFTDLENRQIPDFYRPINAFVDRLIYAGALETVPGALGQVRISEAS